MKRLLIIILFCPALFCKAQTAEQKLTATIKEFHQALVTKNTVSINQQTDKGMSYGHSSGWVETKPEFIKHIETGYIVYESFKEDSLKINMNGNLANARFVADINSKLNGVDASSKIRVLEVWVKKGNRWVLFGRQAAKR